MKKLAASRAAALAEVKSLLHLPLVERLLHAKARKHLFRFSLGAAVMSAGAFLASVKAGVSEVVGVHEFVVDAVGYFVHGAGMVPVLRYVEPVWLLMLGDE